MNNPLLLISGNDIPYYSARLSVHQPTIKEIAYIGEEAFFIGCEFLRFSKNNLSDQDKSALINQTDFDIIMSIMKNKDDISIQKGITGAMMVLSLMFPDYKLSILNNSILLSKQVNEEFEDYIIDNENYPEFKEILLEIFCLKDSESTENKNYNPAGQLAAEIAEKIKKGKEKAAKSKNIDENKKESIFSRYISILAVGENKTINDLMNYTIYQLYDEFQRFQLKNAYDICLQAKIAGAKDIKDVDWMEDIHSNKEEKDIYF